MKRAEVWQIDGQWVVALDHRPHDISRALGRHHPIAERPYPLPCQHDHPTHAEALTAALEAVGLDKPIEHREAS